MYMIYLHKHTCTYKVTNMFYCFLLQISIFWKTQGPSTSGSCQASLEPPSPSMITTINIVSYTLSIHTTQEVQHTLVQVDELLLNWVTPESANAQLSDLQYEIWISINDVSPDDDDDLYDVENVTKVDEVSYLCSVCVHETVFMHLIMILNIDTAL